MPLTDQQREAVTQLVSNTMFANRQALLSMRTQMAQTHGMMYGGDRDLYKVLGWKRTPNYDDYWEMYRRHPVANRVVWAHPEDTWRRPPIIKDGKGAAAREDTPFIEQFNDMADRLDLYGMLEKVDRLSRIGRWGVLFVGATGNGTLTSKLAKRAAGDIAYLTAFTENNAEIVQIEENKGDPRYGLPLLYRLNFGAGLGEDSNKIEPVDVHWSRVIHIAENTEENEVIGTPVLEAILNDLFDMMKVTGGAAEAIWKLAYKGVVVSPKEGYALPSDKDSVSELKDEITDYVNDIVRFMLLEGMDVTEMGGEVVDPSGMYDIKMTDISIKTGIPKRVLMGSEAAELASSQDASTWASRIESRQIRYAEPRILKRFIKHMQMLGALPAPTSGKMEITWPALYPPSQIEQAKIAEHYAIALDRFSGGAGLAVIPPEVFLSTLTPFPADAEPNLEILAMILDMLGKQTPAARGANDEFDGNDSG